MGVSDLPGCKPTDFLCKAARLATRNGVYTPWAQTNIVQAQYYRDTTRYETYLKTSGFLADINNELPSPDPDTDPEEPPRTRNETYVENFTSLHKLVLVLFDQDRTVVPKESSWFGTYPVIDPDSAASRDGDGKIVDMRDQPLYKEDWIGLRALDEKGAVVMITCKGEHMQMNQECWEPIVTKYVGGRQVKEELETVDVMVAEEELAHSQKADVWIPPLLIQDW